MIRRTLTLFVSAVLLVTTLSACGAFRTDTPNPEAAAPTTPANPTSAPTVSAAPTTESATSGTTAAGAIPLYPDAKPLESGSPLAMVVDTMKQQLAQQQSNEADVTVEAYTLPNGTSFDQVKTFYNDSLTKDGWSEVNSEQQQQLAAAGGSMAIWLKNNTNALTVMVMPDPTQSGNSVLLVSQALAK